MTSTIPMSSATSSKPQHDTRRFAGMFDGRKKLTVTFFTPGVPAPQGSKKGFYQHGRVVLVESSKKVKPWRAAVAQAAMAACPPVETGPVRVHIIFHMPRPKSLPKRVKEHVKRPDVDKLVRSTLDALTGVAFPDDSNVTDLSARKQYVNPGEASGATIRIERISE